MIVSYRIRGSVSYVKSDIQQLGDYNDLLGLIMAEKNEWSPKSKITVYSETN